MKSEKRVFSELFHMNTFHFGASSPIMPGDVSEDGIAQRSRDAV